MSHEKETVIPGISFQGIESIELVSPNRDRVYKFKSLDKDVVLGDENLSPKWEERLNELLDRYPSLWEEFESRDEFSRWFPTNMGCVLVFHLEDGSEKCISIRNQLLKNILSKVNPGAAHLMYPEHFINRGFLSRLLAQREDEEYVYSLLLNSDEIEQIEIDLQVMNEVWERMFKLSSRRRQDSVLSMYEILFKDLRSPLIGVHELQRMVESLRTLSDEQVIIVNDRLAEIAAIYDNYQRGKRVVVDGKIYEADVSDVESHVNIPNHKLFKFRNRFGEISQAVFRGSADRVETIYTAAFLGAIIDISKQFEIDPEMDDDTLKDMVESVIDKAINSMMNQFGFKKSNKGKWKFDGEEVNHTEIETLELLNRLDPKLFSMPSTSKGSGMALPQSSVPYGFAAWNTR